MSDAGSGSLLEALHVLRLPDYRRLWAAQTISTIGDQIFPIAAAVSVLDAGGDASDVGLVLGAKVAAIVLFALVGGVWADRLPRKSVMIGADLFRAAAVTALALWPGQPHIAVIMALVFLVGSGEAFFRPAEAALLPTILPPAKLPAANGLISVSMRTAAIIGPGLGGVFVATLGSTRLAYAADAITFLISAAFLLRLREPRRTHPPKEDRTSFLSDLREGAAEVRRHRWIAATIACASLLLMLTLAPAEVLLPIVGRREFATDAVYAYSMVAFSIGGVIGALLAIRFKPKKMGQVAWLSGLGFIGVPLALMFPASPWVLYAANFIGGIAWEPFAVYWPTALQREITGDKLARVSSIDWMASLSLLPLGFALTGPAVSALGEQTVLAVSAVSLVVLSLAPMVVPGVREFREPRKDLRDA